MMIENSVARVDGDKGSGFEELFETAIKTSIRDLLGESPMQAILFHLSMERVGSDPKEFDVRLRKLLNAPASIIEETIIKDLFKRLDVLYSPSGPFDFQRYANSAREAYLHRGKSRIG